MKMRCQVPSARRPSITGIVSLVESSRCIRCECALGRSSGAIARVRVDGSSDLGSIECIREIKWLTET